MGLHQAIITNTLSVPCDCGADDDHGVEGGVEEQSVDYPDDLDRIDDEERPAEAEGITSLKSIEPDGYGSGV